MTTPQELRLFSVASTLAVLLTVPTLAGAGVIPPERTVDWSVAGHPGPIPAPATVVDVTDFGGVGDGVTPAQAAIAGAVSALGGAPGVVWLPAGDYLLTSSVSLPSGVVLRGESATSTTLRCAPPNSGTSCLVVYGAPSGAAVAALGGLERGSTAITVADAAGFTAGGWAELTQDNGAWDTDPADWAKRVVGQVVRVVAVDGAIVSVEHPLRLGYDVALAPTLRPVKPATDVGIETLRIVRTSDPTGSGGGNNIEFSYAVRSWVHGVASEKSIGSHVGVFRSSQIEVRGSVFQDAWTFTGSATRGYGVTLNDHSGECLIEGNIFRFLRHAMMVKTGANGNVFAYNYSREPNRSEAFSDFAGDISVHGHYPFANLFEGNVVASIIVDQYWGRGGPYNTFFRNQLQWYGFIITPDNPTNDQNVVGNAIEKGKSNPLLAFYYTLYYGVLGTGHFTWGNDVAGKIEPPGTATLTDLSYYLQDGEVPCALAATTPPIGPPVSVAAGTNQAEGRWGAPDMTLMPLRVDVGAGATLEVGQSATLTGSAWGGRAPVSLSWSPTAGLSDPSAATTTASPVTTTTYVFTAADAAGCSQSAPVTITVTGKAAAPTFSPPPGEVDEGTPLTLSTTTPDAVLRYTLDGAEVTEAATVYTAPIPLAEDVTIRARAFKVDFEPSDETEGTYAVIPAAPVPDPAPTDDLGGPFEPDVGEPTDDVVEVGPADVVAPEDTVLDPEDAEPVAAQDTVLDPEDATPDAGATEVGGTSPSTDDDAAQGDMASSGDTPEAPATDVITGSSEPGEDLGASTQDGGPTGDAGVGSGDADTHDPGVSPTDAGGCSAAGPSGGPPLTLTLLLAFLVGRTLRAPRRARDAARGDRLAAATRPLAGGALARRVPH